MEDGDPIPLLSALAHDGRLSVLRLLMRRLPGGARPSDLAAALGMKPNTLSMHVTALERVGLVRHERRGRAVYYLAEPRRMGALLDRLVAECRGRPDLGAPLAGQALAADRGAGAPGLRVLFLGTGNCARSILAEALLRADGRGAVLAASAGVAPARAVAPEVAALLGRLGHDLAPLRPKPLPGPGDAAVDLVVTLCDRAADAAAGLLPGLPVQSHWSLPDPLAAADPEAAVAEAYAGLARRVQALAALPGGLGAAGLQRRVDALAG